jgi:hypothetical protein
MSGNRAAGLSALHLSPPKDVQNSDDTGRGESARDAKEYPVVVALPVGL